VTAFELSSNRKARLARKPYVPSGSTKHLQYCTECGKPGGRRPARVIRLLHLALSFLPFLLLSGGLTLGGSHSSARRILDPRSRRVSWHTHAMADRQSVVAGSVQVRCKGLTVLPYTSAGPFLFGIVPGACNSTCVPPSS
jgi:hypothetical protein